MHYLIGSAVKFFCEIDPEEVAETGVFLESLFDPDGNEILSEEAMEYDAVKTNVASMFWESREGVDPVGRYEYVIKAINGSIPNYERGFFHLEERK